MQSPPEKNDLKRCLERALSRFPEVEAAYLFGSRAEGRMKAGSDLDLALVVNQPLGLRKLDILAALTAEGLDNVDLVVLSSDDVVLRFEAVRLNQLVYARKGFDRGGYYSRSIREYLDFLPYLEAQRTARRRRLAHGKA
ncbi:MAG: nucleotidyltransferase domain-containing protein [Gammaproteobacteria bacterium]